MQQTKNKSHHEIALSNFILLQTVPPAQTLTNQILWQSPWGSVLHPPVMLLKVNGPPRIIFFVVRNSPFWTLIAFGSFCWTQLFPSAHMCSYGSIHMSITLNPPICPDICVALDKRTALDYFFCSKLDVWTWSALGSLYQTCQFPSAQWCTRGSINMLIPQNSLICPDICVALGQRTAPDNFPQ